jgi:hypothetical protein
MTYMPCAVTVAGGASIGGTGLPEVHVQRAPAAGPPNICMSHLLAMNLADCNAARTSTSCRHREVQVTMAAPGAAGLLA